MAEIEEIPRVVLLPDEPITNWQADKLDTARFAQVIASAAHHTETPFTIGVFGKWGQGKTSLLRQAQSLIAEHYEEDVTVWFNAWQFEREEIPIVPLILTIAEKLEKQTKDDSRARDYLHTTGRILRGIARAVSLSISTPLPAGPKISVSGKELTDEISKAVKHSPPEILPTTFYVRAFDALTECSNEYSRNAETEGSPSLARVIVFIDDLDRCLPERAVGLLQGIKLVLNQPGFIFVLGLDRQILEDHLVKIYKTAGSRNSAEHGRRFIDKIIQLPLPIPRQDDLAGYIEKLFEREELKCEENRSIVKVLKNLKKLIAMGANANPRNVVRFINNLIVDRTLWILGEEEEELVDGKLLGIGAVSRILREHLRDELYLALSHDFKFCESIANKEKLTEQIWTSHEEERRLPKPKRLRMQISQRLDESPFLQKVLESEFGAAWLKDHAIRDKVDRFLCEERGEEEQREGEPTPSEIAACAIIDGKEIPLSEEALIKVTFLSLDSTDVDDAKLAAVEKLQNLNRLDLSGTKITDAGLAYIENLQNLSMLDLSGTKITDAGLAYIKNLRKLKGLNLLGTKITDAGLAYIENLQNLSMLDLSGPQITDAGLAYIENLQNLIMLGLSGTQITDAGLAYIENLQKLKGLNLLGTKITDAGLAYIENLQNLSTLLLSRAKITDAGLAYLKNLQNLSSLALSETQITDAGLAYIENLQNLSWLMLSGTKITDAGLAYLKNLQNLSSLFLSGTQITDAGLAYIENLQNLSSLDLSGTQITDAGLAYIENLQNLSSLDLSETQITNTGRERLKKHLPHAVIMGPIS